MSKNGSKNGVPYGPIWSHVQFHIRCERMWCSSGATAQCDFKTLHVYFSVRTQNNNVNDYWELVCNWLVELLSNTKLQLRTSVPNSSQMSVNAKSLAANILRFTDIYQITVCSNAVHHMWHHTAPAVPMSDPDCKSKAHTIKAYQGLHHFKCLWKICVLVIPCHGKAVPSCSW
jgi:hypothetical protein